MTATCESCGDELDGPEVGTSVQRIFVQFDELGRPTGETLADGFERWCAICRATYPHQVVDESERA